MADICMCLKKDCPKADKCYRKRAKPDSYQSVSYFENACNKEDGYRHFILHEERKNTGQVKGTLV